MYKQAKNAEFKGNFYHHHTLDGREVDVLIETEAGYYAFEIKKTRHVSNTDVRHLVALQEILNKPLLQGFIVSQDNDIKFLKDNILSLPAALLLG